MRDLLSIGTSRGCEMIGTGIGLGLSGYTLSRNAFKPDMVSGLQLWLDAADSTTLYQSAGGALATADGDPVGQWQDKSGNSRHAGQTDGTKKPSLKTLVQNGKNAILNDGVNDILNLSSNLSLSDITILGVIIRPNNNVRTIFTGSTSNSFQLAWDPDNKFYNRGDGGSTFDSSSAYTQTGCHLLDYRYDSANGSSGGFDGLAYSGSGTITSPFKILNITTLSNVQNATSSYCELLVYNLRLVDLDLNLVRNYLKTKWGIA